MTMNMIQCYYLVSLKLLEKIMKAYTISVTIAAETVDTDDVAGLISATLEEHLPTDNLVLVKTDGVKQYSEQGWKVARQRKFGVGVQQAGDGHKATLSKAELVVESEKADALLQGV